MLFVHFYPCGGFPATLSSIKKNTHLFKQNGRNLRSQGAGYHFAEGASDAAREGRKGSFHKIPLGKERGTRWFQIFFEKFHPYLGKMNPIWLISFRWVETTNQGKLVHFLKPRFPFGAPRKKDVFLFLFLGRRGVGKGGWLDRVFFAIQKDFWKRFFAIFFCSKNQKSSTNSKFGQATWTENFVFGAPRSLPPPQEVCPKKNPKQRRWDRSKRCPMGAIIAPW